jgi:hypothetical protein
VEPLLIRLGSALLLLACSEEGRPQGGSIDYADYSEVWASTLSYRSLSADELLAEGNTDTGAGLEELLHLSVSDGGDGRLLVFSLGDTLAESTELAQMQLNTSGKLSIRSIDGVEQDPEIVLLENKFSDGDEVQSGDWTATTTILSEHSTWYGSFDLVVDVRLDGPTSTTAPGLIRLARDVGPVQLSWGDYSGDLAWYDP